MAGRVLFFGQDTRRSIPALKRAGFAVQVFTSAAQVGPSRIEAPDTAAVVVSGVWEPFIDRPILTVRQRTKVPFVLFTLPGERSAHAAFDLVVPADLSPDQWLADFALLVRQCRETRDQARRAAAIADQLQRRTQANLDLSQVWRKHSEWQRESSRTIREKSQLERRRSRREVARDPGLATAWNAEAFRGLPDYVSGADLGFVPCAERDRLKWSMIQALAQLTSLLHQLAKEKCEDAPAEQIEALQAEAGVLVAELESLLKTWKTHRAAHGC